MKASRLHIGHTSSIIVAHLSSIQVSRRPGLFCRLSSLSPGVHQWHGHGDAKKNPLLSPRALRTGIHMCWHFQVPSWESLPRIFIWSHCDHKDFYFSERWAISFHSGLCWFSSFWVRTGPMSGSSSLGLSQERIAHDGAAIPWLLVLRRMDMASWAVHQHCRGCFLPYVWPECHRCWWVQAT